MIRQALSTFVLRTATSTVATTFATVFATVFSPAFASTAASSTELAAASSPEFATASVTASATASATAFATASSDDPAELMLFPDLITADGQATPVHPSIGEGKWTLVMLWATSCHICAIDKPLFSAFHDKHKDGDITVFGISIDGHDRAPAVQDYLEARDVSFPNSVGEFVTVSTSMVNIAEESLRGTPTYLLFNPAGEISGVHAGHLQPEKVENFIARK